MITTVLIFICLIGILIFVHEAGHFIVARRNGVTVHEFGFGLPPRIVGIVKDPTTNRWRVHFGGGSGCYGNHTLYSINWIPVGGFVRMKNERYIDDAKEGDDFLTQSRWVRFKILIAGVAANFVFGWILMACVLMIGIFQLIPPGEANVPHVDVMILEVLPSSVAEKIGLIPHDIIRQVCDETTCTDIGDAAQFQKAILSYSGKRVRMEIKRGADTLTLSGTFSVASGKDHVLLGVRMTDTTFVQLPFFKAIQVAFRGVIELTAETFRGCWHLIASIFAKQSALDASSQTETMVGPIGIAMIAHQMWDLGIMNFIWFVGIFSINLGIINILPIPALDGGHILFIIIEAIKRKPLNQIFVNTLNAVFFLLIIVGMVVIIYKDIRMFF